MTISERSKTRLGRVISDKMEKTVVVAVETCKRHPMYGKTVKHTRKFKVHDESKTCKVGDVVRIVETRPLSREKHWRVMEIVTKGEVAEIKPEEAATV